MTTRKKESVLSSTPPMEAVEDLLTDSDDEILPSGWDMRVTAKGRVFYVRFVIYTHIFIYVYMYVSQGKLATVHLLICSRKSLEKVLKKSVSEIKNEHL